MWRIEWGIDEKEKQRIGGQGAVIKVVRLSDTKAGALKELHRQHLTNTERRFRMQQEANALIALDGRGVPRLLASNTDRWNERGHELYLVMDWIAGPTLSEFRSTRPLSIDEAVTVAIPILDTIELCHGLPIYHRDLKPDNVILRHGSLADPVLVDFGMAWAKPIEDASRNFDTPAGQELGNRFLRLPEFAPGRDAHDPRSDVSMVVGLVFYMLTGLAPRTLDDGTGRMPHEALLDRFPGSVRQERRWTRLRRVFNIGFQTSLDLRFQNVEQLKSRLLDLEPVDPTNDELRLKEELAEISDVLNSAHGRAIAANAIVLSTAATRFLDAFRGCLSGSGFTYAGSGPNLIEHDRGCKFDFSIMRERTSEPQASFRHSMMFNGTVVVASSLVEDEMWQEYYSGPISDPDGLNEALERRAVNIVYRLLVIMKKKLSSIYG